LGQTHDKQREPKRKLVPNKKHLSLPPRQIETATPSAQLSLGSSSILTCLCEHLRHLAPIDTGTELFRMIDKASFAASKLICTPIAVFWISVSKQHWHLPYHWEHAKVIQMKERVCLYPLRTHQVPVPWPISGLHFSSEYVPKTRFVPSV
jgi:hypothetical protein